MRTEKKKQYDKDYYQKNKERAKKNAREYYQQHKEHLKLASHIWWENNKNDPNRIEKRKATNKKKYLATRQEKLQWQKEHHKKRRIEFLNLVGGGRCKVCGFSDWRALQIDHINGDGHIERKKFGKTVSRKKQFELIQENPQNYQVLCCNCNWIKKYENQEHAKIRIQA